MRPANARAVMADRAQTEDDDPDFFPTWPWAARAGAELVRRLDPQAHTAWECACGHGSMAHGLGDYFSAVFSSDLRDYGWNHVLHDFLSDEPPPIGGPDWIITNPPFKHIERFVELAYARARRGVAMFVPARVLEGQERHALLYERAPYSVFAPFSERVPLHKGRLEVGGRTAAFYAWIVWLKVRRPRMAAPIVMPIAPGARLRLSRPSDQRFC